MSNHLKFLKIGHSIKIAWTAWVGLCALFSSSIISTAQESSTESESDQPPRVPTFAERLGWGPEDKVVLFHTDDAGLSHASNLGAIGALEKGVAKSFSVMMPCSWVPEISEYIRANPEVDAGVHLTLTSEWSRYRWRPILGEDTVPGLVDHEGYFWDNVAQVAKNATPEQVEMEIRAQINRALAVGIPVTHIDSHMGALFQPVFVERYMKVGIEMDLPILIAGGHLESIKKENPYTVPLIRAMAMEVWNAGLPVLDDVHTATYGWRSDNKTDQLISYLKSMPPGVTEVILHCSVPDDVIFPKISSSSQTRFGDYQTMIDPKLHDYLKEAGIHVTTWKELKARRKALSH